jgi:predicted RNA-binding protein with PIN domain
VTTQHFLVDAYNLLFWCLKGENLERERELLIHEVNTHAKRRNLDITLIFDATWTDDPLAQSHFDSLEILFTDKGVTADDHIIYMLNERGSSNFIVVTSDRDLSKRSAIRGAKTLSTPAFYTWLRKNKIKKKESQKKLTYAPAKSFMKEGTISWYEKVFNDRLQDKPENPQS